jgi:Ca-activated chloride channel family protein
LNVTFTWPAMLYALLLMPPLAWLYLRLRKARQQAPTQLMFTQAGPDPSAGPKARWTSPILLAAGLIVLLVALARPQAVVTLPRIEGTAILAFDVSGSMAADDYEPTRLEAAKAAAQAFVQGQPSEVLIGVVAFSDGGFSIQEPTQDREAILGTINRLRPESGTSLANGILASLQVLVPGFNEESPTGETPPEPEPAFSPGSATIILLTDGENNLDPDPIEAARTAADLGVRIHTIGVGSAEGTLLEIEGFIVHTSLDEAGLQAIAEITGGTYFHAGDATDLEEIYSQIEPELIVKTEEMEVTALFAGLGALLLLGGGLVSLFENGRMP